MKNEREALGAGNKAGEALSPAVGPPSTAAKDHCLSSSCDSAY